MTQIQISEQTLGNLVDTYNEAALITGDRQIKRFPERKTAERRVAEILAKGSIAVEPKSTSSARARVIKRLTRHMCSTIVRVKPPASNKRLKFWDRYSDGLTIREIIETEGLDQAQVRYMCAMGCIKLVRSTEEDYRVMAAAFRKARG